MKREMRLAAVLAAFCLTFGAGLAPAQAPGQDKDPFKGKLFPPNVILEHQDALGLTKDQFTSIRATVVDVQASIAEHEWDLREAYLRVLASLDASPVDEAAVLRDVDALLKAENEVKKRQVAMLIRLRNLLTDEQVDYLQSMRPR